MKYSDKPGGLGSEELGQEGDLVTDMEHDFEKSCVVKGEDAEKRDAVDGDDSPMDTGL